MKTHILIHIFSLLLILKAFSLQAENAPEGITPTIEISHTATAQASDEKKNTEKKEEEKPLESMADEPAAFPQESKPQPKSERRSIPQKAGDCTGKAWFGQRVVTEKYTGWGWIKEDEKGGWLSAKWAMIKETPGTIQTPGKYGGDPRGDDGKQYRLYGEWASYKGYEANIDVTVPVFILKGFEQAGVGEPVKKPLPASSGNVNSRISERGANQLRKKRDS